MLIRDVLTSPLAKIHPSAKPLFYIKTTFLAVKPAQKFWRKIKGIQWLEIYFCIQFTYTILGLVVLVKKYLELI